MNRNEFGGKNNNFNFLLLLIASFIISRSWMFKLLVFCSPCLSVDEITTALVVVVETVTPHMAAAEQGSSSHRPLHILHIAHPLLAPFIIFLLRIFLQSLVMLMNHSLDSVFTKIGLSKEVPAGRVVAVLAAEKERAAKERALATVT